METLKPQNEKETLTASCKNPSTPEVNPAYVVISSQPQVTSVHNLRFSSSLEVSCNSLLMWWSYFVDNVIDSFNQPHLERKHLKDTMQTPSRSFKDHNCYFKGKRYVLSTKSTSLHQQFGDIFNQSSFMAALRKSSIQFIESKVSELQTLSGHTN